MIDFEQSIKDGMPPSQGLIDKEKLQAQQRLSVGIKNAVCLAIIEFTALISILSVLDAGDAFSHDSKNINMPFLPFIILFLVLVVLAYLFFRTHFFGSSLEDKDDECNCINNKELLFDIINGATFTSVGSIIVWTPIAVADHILDNYCWGIPVGVALYGGYMKWHYFTVVKHLEDNIRPFASSFDPSCHSNEKLMQEFKGKPLLKRYFKALDSMGRPATNGEIEAAKLLLSPRLTEGEYMGMKFRVKKEDRVLQRPLAPPPSPTPMSKKVKHTNKG